MGDGVAFGPLQLRIGGFVAGYPTKVLIGPVRPLRRPLTIRGRRCSDGRRLRFFYANSQLEIHASGPPYRVSVLEQAGQASAYLKEPRDGARDSFTGYFLFPTAGRYEVKLYAGTSKIDTAVISTDEHAR
jgi:hypothetical protein